MEESIRYYANGEISEDDIKNKNDVQLKKAIEVAQQLSNGTYVVQK